ncbi:MAG: ATP-binding cassette domain-containing protein [Bryobacteraceae bacterium]
MTFPAGETPRAVLHGFNLQVRSGEIVGIEGESGTGKTTLALTLLNLVRFSNGRTSGEVWFEGRNLLGLPESELRAIRGNRMALAFQNAPGALDPLCRVGDQIGEVIQVHTKLDRRCLQGRVEKLIEEVRLSHVDGLARRFPHQISGGEAQRVLLAMALANAPALLIADEPTANLDSDTKRDILDLIIKRNEAGMAVLFISHDGEALRRLTDRIITLRRNSVGR